MRAVLLATFASLALAGSALAVEPLATTSVEVKLSPELQKKAADDYGVRDVQRLADDLKKNVERELDGTGVLAGGRVGLTLVDARPNRPTFKQLGDRPGLSFESFGTGGAAIEGQAISVDGHVTPVRYRWYESDIRQAKLTTTWSDAGRAIDRFAFQLGRGEVYARR